MCIRDRDITIREESAMALLPTGRDRIEELRMVGITKRFPGCLLYTSDAADERSSVDLGGRRIIKKKIKKRTV